LKKVTGAGPRPKDLISFEAKEFEPESMFDSVRKTGQTSCTEREGGDSSAQFSTFPVSGVSRQVLLVEDDPDLLGSLAAFLEAEGYQVEVARHGLEALGRLRGGFAPAVILLDLMMPIMTGWEFRHAQRQDRDLSGIPVIVISGMEDSPRHAAWLEADGYVQKPIPVQILLETVQRYCD